LISLFQFKGKCPNSYSVQYEIQHAIHGFTSAFTKNVFHCPLPPSPLPSRPSSANIEKISIRKIKAELSIYSQIKGKLSRKPMRKLEFLLVLRQKVIYKK
jgi:hypothetical protein